jgi:hypothetical protein
MGSPDELRLPTVSVAVDLLRAGRAPERVELFVPPVARGRTGLAAEVATLLENPNPFVPVREGARFALIGKQAIVWVAVTLTAPEDEVDESSGVFALYDHRHEVRVELDGSEAIDGHVLYSSPADRPRLADHLNQPVHFVRVWTADALYLVNKHHVVRVLELD